VKHKRVLKFELNRRKLESPAKRASAFKVDPLACTPIGVKHIGQ
jgi:hypothetical protein